MSSTIKAIQGKAAAIRIDNLDTDQIMPKQFLRRIDKSGLAEGLLYDLRFDTQGAIKPDFVLNRPQYAKSKLLLGGSNFGCGSSREHAVWGLLDYGFKAIIAPSFAEIFYSNAMGNQLLLVALPVEQVEQLMALCERADAPEISIDVENLEVRCAGLPAMKFEISRRHQEMFLKGVDVVGMSLSYMNEIMAFAQAHWKQQPWTQDVAARMKRQIPVGDGPAN
ncbi:3-isopropylmalate dehydratase small subunit [Curvibacter sp. PAE-UM]|uniref:3-isopropylmalate dehydratase small subunit n=1 Tax=Curvibacter sp. PAE-UM TaxID=1714344 RepID=UPI00070C78F9|nr:3-isopropylmalate dehydratase small subunit [Curvibacter sp. PAE-UM]KRI00670.1 3-isopropylmalate dehydratase [Curvibacter sp. PAE-UM]